MRTLRSVIGSAVLVMSAVVLAGAPAAAASTWEPPLQPMSVTRAFEPPPTPYAAGHRGVDLAGEPGQAVLAAAAGEVTYAGPLAGRGVVVVVHGRLRTTYEPVLATVRRGAAVAAGAQLGRLAPGHAGCPVGACLHWGLLEGEAYLDPLSVLGRPQVRLLPLTGMPQVRSASAARPRLGGLAGPDGPARSPLSPGVAWSAAAVAGAGVIMARRRR